MTNPPLLLFTSTFYTSVFKLCPSILRSTLPTASDMFRRTREAKQSAAFQQINYVQLTTLITKGHSVRSGRQRPRQGKNCAHGRKTRWAESFTQLTYNIGETETMLHLWTTTNNQNILRIPWEMSEKGNNVYWLRSRHKKLHLKLDALVITHWSSSVFAFIESSTIFWCSTAWETVCDAIDSNIGMDLSLSGPNLKGLTHRLIKSPAEVLP